MTYEEFEPIEPIELPSEPYLPRQRPEDDPPEPVFFLPLVNDPEILRVLAVGSRPVVNRFVHRLHRENLAHYSEWTRLIPTPNPGEFMRMLTKRIPLTPEDYEAL